MTGKPAIVLHIGLPKTGTTFLQYQIFSRTPGIVFAHRALGAVEAEICALLRGVAHGWGLFAPLRRARLAGRLSAMLGRPREGEAARCVLVSDENAAVRADDFWRGRGVAPETAACRLASLRARLPEEAGPLRALIGVRRQDAWLASRYAESSKLFNGFDQADFERRMARIAQAPRLEGPHAWLDYDRVERVFTAALGHGQVLLMPLERIADQRNAALAELGVFLGGVDLMPAAKRRLKQRPGRNRLSNGVDGWRLRSGGGAICVPDPLRDALLARFEASNRLLESRVPLGFA